MTGPRLIELVEQNPVSTEVAFHRLDSALNLVLPGSKTHQRYRGVQCVGLAAVVGSDFVEPDYYNPLNPSVPGRVSFMDDNRSLYPGAWLPLEADPQILGGTVPERLGRFTAFALAKINTLTTNRSWLRSYRAGQLSVAPGQVGFAGGLRFPSTLVAVSGLWEVHDHVASQIFANELVIESENNGRTYRNDQDLAEEIEPIFEGIQSKHPDVEAASLQHADLSELLFIADTLVNRHKAA